MLCLLEFFDWVVVFKLFLMLEISVKVKVLCDSGKDICSFSVGELDFEIFLFIVEVVQYVLEFGFICYGFVVGDFDFCVVLVYKLSIENGILIQLEQVLVINGGK